MSRERVRFVAVNARGCRIGQDHPRAKLSDDDVGVIFDLLDEGLSYGEIAKKFDVGRACIQKIANGSRRCQRAERYLLVSVPQDALGMIAKGGSAWRGNQS